MLGSWESIIQKAKEQKEQNKERKAKETKAIDDSLQAISMLLATISVFFVGIKFTLGSVSGCSPSEISWALKLTCSIISDKELVLNIFISILFTMLGVVTLRIVFNPHGIINRLFSWLLKQCTKKRAMFLLRVLCSTAFFASLTYLAMTVSI